MDDKKTRRNDCVQSSSGNRKEQENESVRRGGGCRQGLKRIDGDVPMCTRNKGEDAGMKAKEIERRQTSSMEIR